MTSMEEQETTVSWCRADDTVSIYTTNTVHLRHLRAEDRVVELAGGEDWGNFRVPASQFDPLRGFIRQRKPWTDEQKRAASERMAKAREARSK
jgi:hypothetical protein